MLITVIIWVYLALIFLLYGALGVMGIRRLFSLQTTKIAPSVVVLLGLIITAWLSSVLSLQMKLGMFAHLLTLMGALLILFFRYAEIKTWCLSVFSHKHWLTWVLAALIFLATLLYAVKTPNNPDTPLYHAQAIHWIEEYPAVPGLGNIEPRFGSNTNWFTLIALFSFSFLGGQSFHLVPSFLFLVSLSYFLSGFQNILGGDVRLSQVVKLALIPLAFHSLIDEISSPGTDLPVILSYWLVLCLWLESIEQESLSRPYQVVVFIFAVFLLTFKLSGIPVLLVALFVLIEWVRQKEHRLVWASIGVAVVALLPWIIRTFILTGYWFYPEPLMKLFSPNVDWMIPVDKVLQIKRGVQAWALDPRTSWEDVADLSLLQRLKFWFSNLNRTRQGMTVLALLSPIIFGIASWLPGRNKKNLLYMPVFILGFLDFLFWLLTAPNYRFGYGFVLGLVVIALSPYMDFLFHNFSKYRFAILAVVVLVLGIQQVRVILGSTRDETNYASYMILPADYSQVRTNRCDLDGVSVFCGRASRQCSYHDFPCLRKVPEDVEMRGDTFSEGFRRTTSDP